MLIARLGDIQTALHYQERLREGSRQTDGLQTKGDSRSLGM
jgi:hypothetical protein